MYVVAPVLAALHSAGAACSWASADVRVPVPLQVGVTNDDTEADAEYMCVWRLTPANATAGQTAATSRDRAG